MALTPRQAAEQWFEKLWNQGRRETIDSMLAPDCVIHDGSQDIVGPDAFKSFYDNIQGVFSEVRVDPQFMIAEGDNVMVRWLSTGTEKKTGKRLEVTGMSLMRFHDGKAVEAWQNWDQYGLMQQVNPVPAKAMSAASG
jgi:predicted SnoaL-like aldol condensation-catalyzing enzyme